MEQGWPIGASHYFGWIVHAYTLLTGSSTPICLVTPLFSLHIRSMWETTVMHEQVSGWTVNFGPNSPVYPFLELKTRTPPPPILENFRFGMTKVYSEIPLPIWKTSDLGWPKFTPKYPPPFGKLQIWDDQSLLRNTPPQFGKLQIWDDQSLLRNTPPIWKTSDLGWPKFTPKYPPILENFRFGMTKVYSEIPPPPNWKTSDLGWPKFTPKYPPPIWKTSDLGWPKFTPKYPPPHFGKLQIWDDQSLLRNTPPPFFLENFRFGMTKVYSEIPPPPPKRKLSESSKIFRIPRVTTCGDFIQPG